MSFVRIAPAVVAALVLWCAMAGASGPLRPFGSGPWSGGAYTDDSTGAFDHCSAGVTDDSGTHPFIILTRDYRWWLGVINPKWHLVPDGEPSIRLRIDEGSWFIEFPSIPSSQLLMVSLSDEPHLLAAFRRGSRFAMDADGQAALFALSGIAAMLDQLTNCVRTSVALEQRGSPPAAQARDGAPATGDKPASDGGAKPGVNPRPGGSQPAAQPGRQQTASQPTSAPRSAKPVVAASTPTGDRAEMAISGVPLSGGSGSSVAPTATAETAPVASAPTLAFTEVAPSASAKTSVARMAAMSEPATVAAIEEARLAADFVDKARVPDARLVTAEKPAALAQFAAVWRARDAAGAVEIIPATPNQSGLTIASHLAAADPQLCNGDFSAARLHTMVGGDVVFSAILSCGDAEEQRTTEYFVARRRQGGFVVFAVIQSRTAGESPAFDRHNIEALSQAAFEAVADQGWARPSASSAEGKTQK